MKIIALAVVLAALVPAALAQAPKTQAPVREFTSVNIEVQGNKIWVPSTFIVKKGEKVRIKLINTAPSGVHGFAIDGYGVKVAVNNKEGDNVKTVEFLADKPGLFTIYCQMHPKHVGGQLKVE